MFMLHRSRILSIYIVLYLLSIYFFSTFEYICPPSYILFSIIALLFIWPIKRLRYLIVGLVVILAANYQLLPRLLSEPLSTEGRVIESREGSQNQFLILENDSGVRFTTLAPIYPKYTIGDYLRVTGKAVRRNEDPYFVQNPGYFYVNNIDFTIVDVSVISRGEGRQGLPVRVRRGLIKIRESYENILLKLLPEPYSGLAIGILLGNRQYLSEEINNLFIATGIVHILALSGYNITVIAGGLKNLFGRYSAHASCYLALMGIWLFVAATGFSASVVRAAIMGSLLILAKRFGRQSDSLIAILLAAGGMVALNPYILKYDIGFQLSFLAMVGMILAAPPLTRLFQLLGEKLSGILSSTLAAQLFTLPILSFYFGRISTVSVLANLLVLPFIPLVMAITFVLTTLGFVSLWLAQKFAFVLWIFLAYIIRVAEIFNSLPFAQRAFRISGIVLVGVYLLQAEFVIIWRRRSKVEAD